MAEAVTARWHGDNYQSRVFWENALNLLDETSCVVEVTFEANGPKAFDDVVVRYDPPVPRSGPERIHADYHQVKYHVDRGGHFGFEDFIDPGFIGAKTVSLLERLRAAQATATAPSLFTFLTTYRVSPSDPLALLVSGNDRTLMLEKLFDGTTTDQSRMGKVRKCWRDHLGLGSDEELRDVLRGFRIVDGHRSLDELRSEINLKARVVGMLTCSASTSDFRYDELARQLKVRRLSAFTRETLLALAREEGFLAEAPADVDPRLPVAIRSFMGPVSDLGGASPDNTLMLTDQFRQRYLQDGRSWQDDVRPAVEAFLANAASRSRRLRLIMDAHASIAFLAGTVLGLKSGVDVHLVQKGRVGARTWRADDGTSGPRFSETVTIGSGRDVAVMMSVAQDVERQARSYMSGHDITAPTVLALAFERGPGQQSVSGGGHAAALAEQVANAIRRIKAADPDALVHIFAAVPNSVLFFLGQQHQAVAPCIVYEFDFDRRGNKTYQPSFTMD